MFKCARPGARARACVCVCLVSAMFLAGNYANNRRRKRSQIRLLRSQNHPLRTQKVIINTLYSNLFYASKISCTLASVFNRIRY